MAQLHCYVPDKIADQFLKKAKQAHLSTSKYLALLVKKEIVHEWPKNYFDRSATTTTTTTITMALF